MAASRANAPHGCSVATARPPRAGPASWMAAGRTNWSMALAWVSSSSGTSWGTRASNAGEANAVATPITAPTRQSSHRWASPEASTRASPATATPLATSAQNSNARRGTAVRDGPAHEQQRHLGSDGGHADVGKRGRPVGNDVGLPGHGHEEDAVPEQRNGHAGPQQAEVPPAEGCQ